MESRLLLVRPTRDFFMTCRTLVVISTTDGPDLVLTSVELFECRAHRGSRSVVTIL